MILSDTKTLYHKHGLVGLGIFDIWQIIAYIIFIKKVMFSDTLIVLSADLLCDVLEKNEGRI